MSITSNPPVLISNHSHHPGKPLEPAPSMLPAMAWLHHTPCLSFSSRASVTRTWHSYVGHAEEGALRTIGHPNLVAGKDCPPGWTFLTLIFCKAPPELVWVPAITSLSNLVILALSTVFLSLIHVARCTAASALSEAQPETQSTIFFLKKYRVILPNTCFRF